MRVRILQLIEGARQATGTTVVIDVFRAFSVEAYFIARGAKRVIPVGDVALAYKLKEENPEVILAGERHGRILPGFDTGNSPSQLLQLDVMEKNRCPYHQRRYAGYCKCGKCHGNTGCLSAECKSNCCIYQTQWCAGCQLGMHGIGSIGTYRRRYPLCGIYQKPSGRNHNRHSFRNRIFERYLWRKVFRQSAARGLSGGRFSYVYRTG